MTKPKDFHLADYGGEIDDIINRQGGALFKEVTIDWSKPAIWKKDENAPTGLHEKVGGYLYALIRDHHRSNYRDTIAYIGITNDLFHRFQNHPKAKLLSDMRGETTLSIGTPDFGSYRTANNHNKRAIEELEHILIWAIWPNMNDRKNFSLPGIGGSHAGRAWHIINAGYRFSGRMPREIAYPWMAIKPGRDRSLKATT